MTKKAIKASERDLHILDLEGYYLVINIRVIMDPEDIFDPERHEWLKESLESLSLIGGVSLESLQAIPAVARKEETGPDKSGNKQ